MLAAVIGLYSVAGTFSLSEIAQARADGTLEMAASTEKWLFLGFFFAFAIKAPLWPLHTWLPNAMGEATAPVAVLITAVVDKVGTFAMLRFCLGLFPEASKWATPVVLVLALVSIIYGALLAVGQRDIKRLVAYASISHFGFIILGIFAMTSQGQSGATLYMVNHGLSTAALMLVAGFLISRRGSRLIADYGGVQKVAPVLAGTFLVGSLATPAARTRPVRQRVPGPGRHLHALSGDRHHRHRRHRARRALHPGALPAHHDRPGQAVGREDA